MRQADAILTRNKYFRIGAISILVLGVLVRLVIFFQNHSIFLDEANLARNIIEKPFGFFFQPLDFQQYAPPLFLVIEKVSVCLLGATTYALRLFPLLASIASMGLFYKLLRRFLPHGLPLLFALFIFSFGAYYLHYAVEGKQYASDMLLVLLILWLTLYEKGAFDGKKAVKWAIVATLYICLSMPSVFILSGVGLFFGIKILKGKSYQHLWKLLASVSVWLLAFGIYYVQILSKDIQVEGLQSFHQNYFLPLLPSTQADFVQYFLIFRSIIETSVGHTAIAIVAGSLFLLFGIRQLIRKDKALATLFLLPILTTLAAAALHKYSLIPRLMLFFMPIILLIMALGIQFLLDKAKIWQKWIIITVILLIASLHTGITFFWQNFEIENTREAMDYIQKNKIPNDVVYVNQEAWPAFYFYKNLYAYKEKYHFDYFVKGDWHFQPKMTSFAKANRVWLLHSHLLSEASQGYKNKELEAMKPYFTKKSEKLFTGASAALYHKNNEKRHSK